LKSIRIGINVRSEGEQWHECSGEYESVDVSEGVTHLPERVAIPVVIRSGDR